MPTSKPPKHPEPLSPRQADVLDAVVRVYRVTKEPVSATTIAKLAQMTRSTVREHLAGLHDKGWLMTRSAPAKPAPDYLQ